MKKKLLLLLIPAIAFISSGGCKKPTTAPELPTPTPVNTAVTVENVLDGVFAEGSLNYVKLKIDSAGTLYVAYVDDSVDKLTVKRLTQAGTTWETLGGGFVVPGIAYGVAFELNESGVPYVAFTDNDYSKKATVMKYNNSGNSWEVVGTRGFTPGSAQLKVLSVTGDIPVLAFSDGSCGGKLTVMRYDASGNSFTALGGGCMTPESLKYAELCIHENSPIVAYGYNNDRTTRIKKFDEDQDTWISMGPEGFCNSCGVVDFKISNNQIFLLHVTAMEQEAALELEKYNDVAQDWDAAGGFLTKTLFNSKISLEIFKNTQYASYIDGYTVGPQKQHILKYNQSESKWEEIFIGPTWTYILSIAGWGDYLYFAYHRPYPSEKGYIKRILQ